MTAEQAYQIFKSIKEQVDINELPKFENKILQAVEDRESKVKRMVVRLSNRKRTK